MVARDCYQSRASRRVAGRDMRLFLPVRVSVCVLSWQPGQTSISLSLSASSPPPLAAFLFSFSFFFSGDIFFSSAANEEENVSNQRAGIRRSGWY